jgi:hypothetical protein
MPGIERCPALRFAALFAVLFVLQSPAAFAQAEAQVTGIVTDPTGAAVVGASVNLVETARGIPHATKTDATGRYILSNLPVGLYRLEAASPGFKTYIQSGITLQVNDRPVMNVPLQVGSVSDSVEVVAASAMVQTAQNSISQVIDSARIMELPLNGRVATELVLLSGAAVALPTTFGDLSTSKTVVGGIAISVAGGQGTATNYMLDGGHHIATNVNLNLPFPFPDALQEFSVETSALTAQNGSQTGGLVNAVTKSGSNRMHGNLFHFLRNGNTNARNYFAAVHDSLKRNQFGGTLGGKIIQDKMFYFAGYQGTRTRESPPQRISIVPTAAAIQGDLSTMMSAGCQSSGRARTITDPLTRQPFPGARIPTSRYDPAAVNLLKYIPAAQDACGQVTWGLPNIADEDQFIGRVDWVRSDKQTLFGRFFMVDYRKPQGDPLVWSGKYLVTLIAASMMRVPAVTIGHTYTFGPTSINSFRATFTRVRNNRGSHPNQIDNGVLGVKTYLAAQNEFQVTATNYFLIGCGQCSAGHFNLNTYYVSDSIDLVRGKHQIALGGSFTRTQNNLLTGVSRNGAPTFSGIVTGDTVADMFLGYMSAWAQTRAEAEDLRLSMPALFVQDTYRASRHLTINAGLRWQPGLFPADTHHRGSVWSMANFLAGKKSQVFTKAPAGSLYYGDPGVPDGFTKDVWAIFSPRVGVVWDPNGDGKQTIRVGGSIMYDNGNMFYPQRVMSNDPFGKNILLATSAERGYSDPWVTGYQYPGGSPFPGISPPPKDVQFELNTRHIIVPSELKPMYVTSWNFSYQRQLSANWMASLSYMGNKTTHLWSGIDANPSVYIPGTCGSAACSTTANANVASRRYLTLLNPNEGKYYGQLTMGYDGGTANYNGVLATVQHRMSRNFSVLANYTWSHCIGTQDRQSFVGVSGAQNQSNFRAETASCIMDVRHNGNISGVFSSPSGGGKWMGRLLGNWQVAPMIRANSGMPFNITSGRDNSLTAVANDRPNLVQPGSVYKPLDASLQWLNPAAFAQNAAGTFGNLGRNAVTCCSSFRFDMALNRTIPISEQLRLDVRAEAFNAINHTSFTQPSGVLTSSVFGKIQGALDPRILQFALKLQF